MTNGEPENFLLVTCHSSLVTTVVMKQSIYLETSVVGAYLDNGEPFRRDLTIRWWEHEMEEYRTVVSPLVVRELERVPEPHRTGYLKLAAQVESVELTDEAA